MANIQYIGARYVPKFYENPNDSSNNWKSGVSYEPLTVVTYLDDSYTSKITVPASVGNPAANSEYWVKTGNYNAAVTALQNQVNNIDNVVIPVINKKIDEINGRPRYIFIADSYGLDVAPHNVGWCTRVKTMLHLTEGVDVFTYVQGGGGFVGSAATTFNDLLTQAHNDITDDDSITDIIVVGGYNDIGKSGVNTAITTFVNNAYTYFPKAKVTVEFAGGYDPHNNSNINASDFLVTKEIYQFVNVYKSIPDAYSILLSYSGFMSSDGIHPTPSGMEKLSIAIAQTILGGVTSEVFSQRSMSLTPASTVTVGGTYHGAWRRTKSAVKLWQTGANYTINASGDTRNTAAWFTLGTLSNIILNGLSADADRSMPFPVYVTTNDNVKHFIVGQFTITPTSELRIQIPLFKSDNTWYLYNEVAKIDPLNMCGDMLINAMCV